MFDSIHGRLVRREPTRAVVEAGGLGYEVHLPLSTYEALPPLESEARLLLHPVVREDEWRLFGFATAQERDAFRALLRVSGVGPVVALGLLSGLRPHELADAVVQGDVRALTRVKGVGRKTAERIVVELRDVFARGTATGPAAPGGAPRAVGPAADAVRALVALGLEESEARRRVDGLGAAADAPVADLVRAALRAR